MKNLTDVELEPLSRVTRITGDIPEGYGILLVKYDVWFEFLDEVHMSITIFDGSESLLADSRNEQANYMGFPLEPLVSSLVKRPYPNKKYISLVRKNGRRHADNGVPLMGRIEDLNRINRIEFRTWTGKTGEMVDRRFSFPVSISITEVDNLACIHFKDMTYYNVKDLNAEHLELKPLKEQVTNLQIQSSIDDCTARWLWTYWADVEQKEIEKYKEFNQKERLYWLKYPEEEFALGYEDEPDILPDSLFLGLTFHPFSDVDEEQELPDNIIRIQGSKNPVVFLV